MDTRTHRNSAYRLKSHRGVRGSPQDLIGVAANKPFECVGTIDEVNTAVRQIITKHDSGELPALLHHYLNRSVDSEHIGGDLKRALKAFGPHNIPDYAKVEYLKKKVDAL